MRTILRHTVLDYRVCIAYFVFHPKMQNHADCSQLQYLICINIHNAAPYFDFPWDLVNWHMAVFFMLLSTIYFIVTNVWSRESYNNEQYRDTEIEDEKTWNTEKLYSWKSTEGSWKKYCIIFPLFLYQHENFWKNRTFRSKQLLNFFHFVETHSLLDGNTKVYRCNMIFYWTFPETCGYFRSSAIKFW